MPAGFGGLDFLGTAPIGDILVRLLDCGEADFDVHNVFPVAVSLEEEMRQNSVISGGSEALILMLLNFDSGSLPGPARVEICRSAHLCSHRPS